MKRIFEIDPLECPRCKGQMRILAFLTDERAIVVHTPGHTPEHISFLITDRGGGADEPIALATGDFLFVGDVGRPDLLESAAGFKDVMRGGSSIKAGEEPPQFRLESAELPDSSLGRTEGKGRR
jgi:hypothetical protein